MANLDDADRHTLARWRLVLGKSADSHGIGCSGDTQCDAVAPLIGYLFGDDGGVSIGAADQRSGGSEDSRLTVPAWVDQVSELFPNQAREVMERELINRRGLRDLLTEPKLLEKIEPNVEIVKTLLTHRDLLNADTRALARKLIEKVVNEVKEKMRVQIEQTLIGAIRRDKHSPRRVFRNLDLKTTVRRNLRNYDTQRGRLLVEQLYFFAAESRKRPWHVIVTVDQSGSMLESAIFSAIMASIFAELPAVKTSLVLFDTQIVDLSDQVGEPVDVLLTINLGGGTDITQALQYSQQLAREPARTIVVLITDFYEGRAESDLVRQVRAMSESGVRMIGLGALSYNARASYNRSTAKKCRKVGMDILSCTPEKLAECMAQIIRG